MNAVGHDHALEIGCFGQECLKLRRRAKAHDAFHARPVVPGAVKRDELSSRWKMRDVTLEVPLSLFGFGWLRQGDIAGGSGVHELADRKDCPTLAGSVPAFKDADDTSASILEPILKFDELDLKPLERFFIFFRLHLGRIGISA